MFAKDRKIFQGVTQRTLGVVIVLGLLAWLMVGCSIAGVESDPAQTITAEDLIVPESILPEGWEYASKPRPLGPSTVGFGDENDLKIVFWSNDPDKPERLASLYILHLKDDKEAKYWYRREVGVYFGQDLFRDLPLFPSQFTSNLRVGCIDSARPNHIQCVLLGQYDEFVVLLNAVIPEGYTTPEEFDAFARRIDRFIGERLAQR